MTERPKPITSSYMAGKERYDQGYRDGVESGRIQVIVFLVGLLGLAWLLYCFVAAVATSVCK